MDCSNKHEIAVLTEVLSIAAMVLCIQVAISNAACHENEKQALLAFKQDLTDPANRLASWTADRDCCNWAGVVCHNRTGHVLKLRLGNLHDPNEDLVLPGKVFESTGIGGKINPSLLDLKHLRYLDLSGSDFGGVEIPKFLGSLQNLRYLNLSISGFGGLIPPELGNLTNLRYLDIEGLFPILFSENLQWLSNLQQLQYLDLSTMDLSRASDWLQVTNELPSLVELRLPYCQLGHIPRNRLILNVSSNWVPPFRLGVIGLSSWNLGPSFPSWLRFQKDFVYLDISLGGISDTIPNWFWNLSTQFFNLNMSHNHIQGKVPEVFDISPPLVGYPVSIDLSSNLFEGSLPCLSSNVETLELSNNSFSGMISRFLCYKMDEPKILENLHLADNHLTGKIPDCWMNWPYLLSIDLKNNDLTGNLPSSIGTLTHLRSLHLRRNNLSGVLPDSMQNCTALLALDLSGNSFTGDIPSWIGETLSNIIITSLGSNNFRGQIPETLCSLSYLTILDLGHNSVSGDIPKCFMNFSAMSIKRNSSVPISYSFGHFGQSLETTLLMIKGILLEYSTTLRLVTSIDLSDNNLSGIIPEEITSLVGLFSLNLSTNHLTGHIPGTIGQMGSLESLDLSYNQLSGQIPLSMSYLTFLSVLDLAYNNLTGKIPSSTQLQSFSASNFAGNSLCGPPVTANCSTNGPTAGGGDDGRDDDGGKVDWLWFFVSMALGFVVGFWGFMGPLFFVKSWRWAYYGVLDDLWYRIYYSRLC
ncbi:hypothetical protein SLEP1_g28008 [Rubroshorea leprosula]|uniref:Leucine-rich repeat-containing N-terminal plant-type domain-containing protein n=1 Tax=Rubroshorea leprosula TaxID=152421 RepID=A0AAV5JZC0_9ROSI|nr:hypothetical protein SLEP1_g28008 [Rubroshorea leprosula]